MVNNITHVPNEARQSEARGGLDIGKTKKSFGRRWSKYLSTRKAVKLSKRGELELITWEEIVNPERENMLCSVLSLIEF